MSRTINRIAAAILVGLVFLIPQFRSTPRQQPVLHSILRLEHRGKTYRLEDLTNPEFRAHSTDSFVKEFSTMEHVATEWAGLNIGETPEAEFTGTAYPQ